jgi:hypothetical protein
MEDDLKGMTTGQLLHHMMDSFQSPEEKGYQMLDHAYKHLTPLPPLPKGKICALPGCGRKVGIPPWTIMGKPEEYCSRACTDLVFQAGKKGRNMKVPATDFGGLLTRLKCDVCNGPVLINWKSRDGKDCCSRECQKKAEEDSMTTENETTDTTTDPKPITAGAAAPAKKSGKKASAKATPAKAKKPVKKAAALGKAPKVTPEKNSRLAQVIALLQRKSGCTLDELVEKTGWKKHTAQMFIYTSLPKAGHTATSTKAEGKERTFFLK